MRRNDLSEFEMEKEGFRIKLKKGADPVVAPAPIAYPPYAPAPQDAPAPALAGSVAAEAKAAPREITSPMVGTFYSSPTPEANAYVQAGSEVTEETVVCIIEAMKVMNEIKAETRGVIAEVMVENGKPVQYGQALFRLK